jgi:phosphoglycolate phosphatase
MNALVMFDYDGVLVDSFDVFTAAFLAACRKCGFCGITSRAHLIRLFDRNLFEALQDFDLDDRKIGRILQTFETEISGHLDTVALFSGMAAALKAIAHDNHVFIITSNVSQHVSRVLNTNGVNCFEDVLGAEKEKSKTRKIRQTKARYTSLPAYYVGDTTGDIIEGKKADTLTIAVTWGWHDAGKLAQADPDFMVSSPAELTKLLCNDLREK